MATLTKDDIPDAIANMAVLEHVWKEDAEKAKAQLEEAGATVELKYLVAAAGPSNSVCARGEGSASDEPQSAETASGASARSGQRARLVALEGALNWRDL